MEKLSSSGGDNEGAFDSLRSEADGAIDWQTLADEANKVPDLQEMQQLADEVNAQPDLQALADAANRSGDSFAMFAEASEETVEPTTAEEATETPATAKPDGPAAKTFKELSEM